MPAAMQTLLDDAYADVDEWRADEVEASFSTQESAAFVTGDGSNKPKGFLSYDMVADASYAWDKIGFILSGAAGAFAASDPADKLINLVYALKSQFRPNARFVMNRRTVSAVRMLKDGDGNYLWRPGAAGEAASRSAIRRRRSKTCQTSPRTPMLSLSVISGAAISSSTGRARACCATPTR